MIQETELLAPAGNWECARAAVANGADAIYFGLPKFNARIRADNFTEEDLPELMTFLHQNGVKGFLAFNTLIFTHELEAAERQLAILQDAKVDGVIIQDLGLALLCKAVAPQVELHASTQMTITSPEALAFAAQLGLDRAVLARELSLREMERFKDVAVPLEVFVHGALCVAYSGQCLTSESLGRRSANRGECAQACRMPYQLIVDGQIKDLGDKKYLLSPQDLAAVDQIPELIERGIMSFKIEGRLKSPEYVAAVTRVYRKAIDAALAGNPSKATADDRYSLEMTFSRGLYPGWVHGVNHQELVTATYGKKRGAYLGRVARMLRDGVQLDRAHVAVKPGDGVVFGSPEDTNDEQGGFLYEADGTDLTFGRGKIDWQRVGPGDHVWKTSDPALDKHLRSSFKGTITPRKRVGLTLSFTAEVGKPLSILVSDGTTTIPLTSETPLEEAKNHPLTSQTLLEQFNRLGGTIFYIAEVVGEFSTAVMLPLSELGKMRRKLVSLLGETLQGTNPPAITGMAAQWLADIKTEISDTNATPANLTVLCRSLAQIQAVAALGVAQIYADFEDVRGYTDAVAWMRTHCPNQQIFLATPRIQKSSEQGFFNLIQRAEPHGILVRNLGALVHFREAKLPMVGDFSLNVANPLTARFLKQQGLERLTVSYDLNIQQVLDLVNATPSHWLEVTVHQHMPMFHMEHCVFAAFMSKGTSFLDCGRPCESHTVKLRDRVGMEHPLKADVGCRNTLFNAVPQTAAKYFSDLTAAGLRNYRVELLNEPPDAATSLVKVYQDLLTKGHSSEATMRLLHAKQQYGVTSGTLDSL